MESSVTLREEPTRTVAYLSRQGPYPQIPEALGILMRHVQDHRYSLKGPPVAVFYTDPKSVPADQARWEVRAPIGPHDESEPGPDGVGVKTLGARTLAVLVHIGPYDSVAQSYENVQDWIEDHGYSLIGPLEEAYLSGPDMPPDKVRTEIRFPVALEPVAFGA
jgi:AraC family transcriptional regulator